MARITDYEMGWRDCHKQMKAIMRDATAAVNKATSTTASKQPKRRSRGRTSRHNGQNKQGSNPKEQHVSN